MFASTLSLLIALSPIPVARSQTATIATPSLVAIQFEPPAALPPPPVVNDPGSGRSQGGAGRGCDSNRPDASLTPLVPLAPGSKTVRWGVTTTDRPTFWLDTSRGIKEGAMVILVLQEGMTKASHRLTFQIPSNTPPTVLSFPIPDTAPPLQADTPYRWEIRLFCHSGTSSTLTEPSIDSPLIFSGGIQRITPSAKLQHQLAAAKTPLDRATAYASNGIWYDALTTLGLQVREKTVNPAIARAWSDLLHQANLVSTSSPISPCCQPKE